MLASLVGKEGEIFESCSRRLFYLCLFTTARPYLVIGDVEKEWPDEGHCMSSLQVTIPPSTASQRGRVMYIDK